MAFWYSKADSAGARISGFDVMLSPGPSFVRYPKGIVGKIIETDDQSAIVQQSTKDGRQRQWVWANYRPDVIGYQVLWEQLNQLRSRNLIDAGAATPYVYLKETESGKLRRKINFTGTVDSPFTSTTLQENSAGWTTNQFALDRVALIDGTGAGQERKIVSNDSDTLTITPAWGTNPDGTTTFSIISWVDDWFKCRVLSVTRDERERGGLTTFTETMLIFVIDDTTYNWET